MTLQGKSCLKCISHKCGKEYPIPVFEFNCTCGNLLDVKYNDAPSQNLKEVFYQRRNPQGSIFNESGVWRFRELLNFCEIDTEDLAQCSQHLVSLDGAEGKQSKPYHMSKVAKFVGIENEKLMLQPEGYNPSGSFKDNGMSAAVTHAKLVGAKKIICASTGNTSASAGMFAANENMECDVSGNYTVNSINPFRIEGQKTIPYRVLEFLEWKTPDWIVYPGGALGNTSSCGKCLMELYEWGWIKKIPRIAVINAEGANTLDVLYNGKFDDAELRWNNGSPDTELIERYYTKMNDDGIRPKTKATAIQIGKPSNLLKGLRALEYTDGIVISVTDKEMLDGMSVVGLNGFDCEMASGAVPAGIKKLLHENIMKKDDEIVGILTGRQKEPLLPINYHNEPTNQFARPPKR